jgi:hypothetical protein
MVGSGGGFTPRMRALLFMANMGEKMAPDFGCSPPLLLDCRLVPLPAVLWKEGILISCLDSESRTAASAAKGHVNPCFGAIL